MGEGKITLYVAVSVDGFLAAEDGGVEWLEAFQSDLEGGDDDLGYEEFVADVDCLVMGSKTYEQVLEFGEWPYEEKPTYVLTRRNLPVAAESVELVEGDASDLAGRLKRQYRHVWLVGGAQLARSLLRADQIEELRLNVIPILLSSGIPLFGDTGRTRELDLLDATTRVNGIVELHYRTEG